jgi:hypothetical protein
VVWGSLFPVPFVAGAVALVLGALALKKSAGTRHRGVAVAGMLLGCFLWQRARAESIRMRCAQNLKQIGSAWGMYVNDTNRMPPNLQALTRYMWGMQFRATYPRDPNARRVFICPATDLELAADGSIRTNYIFMEQFAGVRHSEIRNKPYTVLLYEPLAHHGGLAANFLCADFHIEMLDGPLAAQVVKELESGQNPPPSLRPAPSSANSG